jgi:type VI secretion system protein
MPLTLKIVSKQRHILGADSLRVFSVRGGSIGRAPDNDWVLPDPDRYISGHHASIDYRDGAYYLRDNSTNGVFVNKSDHPVGRGAGIRLYDGDELRMGDYLFGVSIVNVSRDGADDSGDTPGTRESRRATPAAEAPAPALSLKLLGDAADQLEGAANALNADEEFASTVRLPDHLLDTADELDKAVREAVDRERVNQLRNADSALVRINVEAPATTPPTLFAQAEARDFTEALRLLMEAAGLDSTQVAREKEEEVVAIAGRLIRATAEGLQAVLRSQGTVKARYKLPQATLQMEGNNPLNFSPTTQDTLEQMFYETPQGYLGPVESIEDAFREIRAHEEAMLKAMQAVLRDLLNRLEPGMLEERFERSARNLGLSSGASKAQFWDMYRDAYRAIAGFSDEHLTNMPGGKLAEAYERELQQAKESIAPGKPRPSAKS